MPRRCSVLAATLFLIAAVLGAESPGARELGLGKESLAHRDFHAAAEHLTAATQTLDPQSEKEALADAWLQLGIADLTGLIGLDHAADALAAFRKSAELAASPSSAWLWAATAAEKLGHADEAADLKARALAPPPAPEPPAAPEPVQAKAAAAPAPAPELVQAKAPEPTPEPPQPEAQPAPEASAPTPAPAPEKAPAAAPQPKPSAFLHFFGPKERKTPPAPAKPAPAPAAPPAAPSPGPTSAAPAPPVKEGAAFQHLFGENRPDRPAGAREAQAEGPEGRKAKEEKAKAAAATTHRDALELLFGEKKREVKKGDGKKEDGQKEDGKPPEPKKDSGTR